MPPRQAQWRASRRKWAEARLRAGRWHFFPGWSSPRRFPGAPDSPRPTTASPHRPPRRRRRFTVEGGRWPW
eukprot:9497078-Pyramimonas_sp.AAC.1